MVEEKLISEGNEEDKKISLEDSLIGWCSSIILSSDNCEGCEEYIDGKCNRYKGLPKTEFDKKFYA